MNRLILSIYCSMLFACSTTSVLETPLETFPIAPKLEKYVADPIVSKLDNDQYVVTSTFVYNSVLLKEYNDKIEAWRLRHRVE